MTADNGHLGCCDNTDNERMCVRADVLRRCVSTLHHHNLDWLYRVGGFYDQHDVGAPDGIYYSHGDGALNIVVGGCVSMYYVLHNSDVHFDGVKVTDDETARWTVDDFDNLIDEDTREDLPDMQHFMPGGDWDPDLIELFHNHTTPRISGEAVKVLLDHDLGGDLRQLLDLEAMAAAGTRFLAKHDHVEHKMISHDGHSVCVYRVEESDGFVEALDRSCAAVTIQRAWRRCRYEPTYKMCSTVLLHDLEELGAIVSAADATH